MCHLCTCGPDVALVLIHHCRLGPSYLDAGWDTNWPSLGEAYVNMYWGPWRQVNGRLYFKLKCFPCVRPPLTKASPAPLHAASSPISLLSNLRCPGKTAWCHLLSAAPYPLSHTAPYIWDPAGACCLQQVTNSVGCPVLATRLRT